MTAPGAARLTQVDLAGPAGWLEAVIQESHEGTPAITAVVCHPHPLYGGTLHNKVTHRVASTLRDLGAATVRFNFRGVGRSEGTHDQGVGELEDARTAWGYARERWPGARRWLAGFSFGAWIASRLAAEERDVERVLLVAPSLDRGNFTAMRKTTVPKFVVQGSADTICPPNLLEADWKYWAEPKRLVMVDGAGHFFDRKLDALSAAVRELFGT